MTLVTHRGEQYEYVEQETGAKLFSVTQIRRCAHDTYAGIPEHTLEAARHRGTLLHRRFWKVLGSRDELCHPPFVLPTLEGYCGAMDLWADTNQVQPVRLEEPSANLKLGYAGTPDAEVVYGPKAVVVLVDLKSGAPTLTDPMQLLGYHKMTGYDGAQRLLDLYIRKDGTYKEVWVTAREKVTQWPAFINSLNLLTWRVNNGVKI